MAAGGSSRSRLAAGGSSRSQLAAGRAVEVSWLQAEQQSVGSDGSAVPTLGSDSRSNIRGSIYQLVVGSQAYRHDHSVGRSQAYRHDHSVGRSQAYRHDHSVGGSQAYRHDHSVGGSQVY